MPVQREGGFGDWGREKVQGCFPEGDLVLVLCVEGFYFSLAGRHLRGGPGEGFSRIFISFPGVPFQGSGLHSFVSSRAGGHLSLQLVLLSTTWFCCFSGHGTNI